MLYNPSWAEPKVDAVGQHLLCAAEYLRDHGWTRHEFQDADGHVCLAGAIHWCKGFKEEGALRRITSYLGMKPDDWNDFCCHSMQEAWEALISAAYSK